MPDMLTTKEAAERLRIQPATLAQKANLGQVPGVKVGRTWLFKRELIERILAGESPSTPSSPEA